MAAGDWIIDNFVIPWPISAKYSHETLELTCLAIKSDDEDPREEIKRIERLVSEDYSISKFLTGKWGIQGLKDKFITITDGLKTWEGLVTGVEFKENEFSDKAIIYTIKMAVLPYEMSDFTFMEVPPGDEVTTDDDWEVGWESFTLPGQGGSGVVGCNQPQCDENKIIPSGCTLQNLTVIYCDGAKS